MKNTKLIALLQKLSTRERSRFSEYVHSPFFNKHKKVKQLCDYLLHWAPEYPQEALAKVRIYAALFGET
ncbi:MAG: hypothetical protein AAGD05_15165, partial [Bacteroidota bacterium]